MGVIALQCEYCRVALRRRESSVRERAHVQVHEPGHMLRVYIASTQRALHAQIYGPTIWAASMDKLFGIDSVERVGSRCVAAILGQRVVRAFSQLARNNNGPIDVESNKGVS